MQHESKHIKNNKLTEAAKMMAEGIRSWAILKSPVPNYWLMKRTVALGSGQHLLYRLGSGLGLVLSLIHI